MIQSYNKSKIKQCLYRLKQEWGANLTWYIFESTDRDLESGLIDVNYTQVNIRRAIIMPSLIDRTFHYTLTFLAAGKNFVYGGYHDRDVKNIIVDLKDVPYAYRDREPNANDKMILNNKRYSISKVEYFEHGMAALFIIKNLVGSQRGLQFNEDITQGIGLNASASGTLA